MPAIPDAVEARHAVLVAAHGLAVDDAGARVQAGERLDDQREAVGEIIAGAAVEPHLYARLAGDNLNVTEGGQAVVAGDKVTGRTRGRRRDDGRGDDQR